VKIGIPKTEPLEGWQRPHRLVQMSLFSHVRDEFLAAISVSLDEAVRWRKAGWLNFDPTSLNEFNDVQTSELSFVRELARSGLSDAMVSRLLQELEPPYTYNDHATAYHFQYGWVALPSPLPSAYELIEERIEEWAEECLEAGDTLLLDRIVTNVLAYRKAQQQEKQNEKPRE